MRLTFSIYLSPLCVLNAPVHALHLYILTTVESKTVPGQPRIVLLRQEGIDWTRIRFL